jgi:hypothetical protein
MPQENLNKIWNAGKYFEQKPEQDLKPTPDETKPSNVKRKINVAKAFMPEQEDPFKQKVKAVLKGIEETEPASVPTAAGEEEKTIPTDAEEVIDEIRQCGQMDRQPHVRRGDSCGRQRRGMDWLPHVRGRDSCERRCGMVYRKKHVRRCPPH